MNGPQDLGGMQGFGPVHPEAHEPLFHAPWEARAMAVTVAMGATGTWNIDQSRFRRESIGPALYYASSYYEIWWSGLEGLLQDFGLVSAGEIASGRAMTPPVPVKSVLSADKVHAALKAGSPTTRAAPPSAAPAFKPGDQVHTRNDHPAHHTRLPRYLRDKTGTVLACHGHHVFPDSNAQGLGENPQVLYTVEFDARELWGEKTTADSVCADLFEPYLIATGKGRG